MSDSHKCKLRNKTKRQWNQAQKEIDRYIDQLRKKGMGDIQSIYYAYRAKKSPYEKLSEEQSKMIVNYSKNPGWWNHLTHTTKARRQDRDKLKVVDLNTAEDFDDAILFPARKPKIYYW